MNYARLFLLICLIGCTSKTVFEARIAGFRELTPPLYLSSEKEYEKDLGPDTSLGRKVYGRVFHENDYYAILSFVPADPNSMDHFCIQLTTLDIQGKTIDSIRFFGEAIGQYPGGSTYERVVISPERTIDVFDSLGKMQASPEFPGGKDLFDVKDTKFKINNKGIIERVGESIVYTDPEKTVQQFSDSLFSYRLLIDTIAGGEANGEKQCTVKRIAICSEESIEPIQTIAPPENSFSCFSHHDTYFALEDMNFDGATDFRLEAVAPGYGNIPFYYWLFDSKKNSFQQNAALDEIPSPNFDHEKRLITSDTGTSSKTYQFVNGQLKIIEIKTDSTTNQK